jgi:hypothetical protein
MNHGMGKTTSKQVSDNVLHAWLEVETTATELTRQELAELILMATRVQKTNVKRHLSSFKKAIQFCGNALVLVLLFFTGPNGFRFHLLR